MDSLYERRDFLAYSFQLLQIETVNKKIFNSVRNMYGRVLANFASFTERKKTIIQRKPIVFVLQSHYTLERLSTV